MSRKVWIGLAIVGLVGVLLAGGAAAGLFLYRQHQEREWLANAREYVAEEEYGVATSNYVNYLARKPRDTEVLREYIEANLQRTDNRANALQDAITGYMQLLRYEPGDQEAQEELADLLYETESWGRLEFQMQRQLQENPDDEEARYMQALAVDNLDRVQDAIDLYWELVEEETTYADVYGNLAIRLHQRGLSSQAAEALEAGEEHVGDDPEFHLTKAQYHVEARESEAAEAAYETALDLAPDNPDVLAEAASFFAEQNRPNRALELVERALENEPEHVQSRITHAQVKQRQGELETARDILESLDAYERHEHPGAMIALAEIYLGLEDTDNAMEVVDEHLEGYEGQSLIREYVTGRTFLLEGEPERAASRLANVHDQAPSFGPAQFHLIVAYLQSGRRTDARAVLESYLRRYPDEQQARLLMAAEAGTETSDEQLAELALNLLDSGSTDTGALMNSAVNLFEVGMARGEPRERLSTVEQLLERAMEHEPNDPQPYLILADIRLALGDTQEARDVADNAQEAGLPEDEFRIVYASAALAEGDEAEAYQQFELALESGEFDGDRALQWAQMFEQLGGLEEALESIASSLDQLPDEQQFPVRLSEMTLLASAGNLDEALDLRESLYTEYSEETSEETQQMGQLESASLQVARLCLQTNDPEYIGRAEDIIEGIQERSPENLRARVLQAELLLRKTPPAPAEAELVLSEVLNENPEHFPALLAMSEVRAQQGALEEARNYLERVLNAAPRQVSPRLRYAELSMRLEDFDEAETTLEQLMEANPGNLRAQLLLVELALYRGDTDEARDRLDELAPLAEDNPLLAQELENLNNRLAMAEQDPSEIAAEFRESYDADPTDLTALRNLVRALRQAGETGEAEELLEMTAENHTEDPELWILLGQFRATQDGSENLRRASTAFTRALMLEPENLAAITEMIEVQRRLGNLGEAASLCERYLEQRPDSPQMHFRRASLLAAQGQNPESALESVDEALALRDATEYRALRGFLRVNTGDYEGATEDLEAVAAEAAGPTTAQLDIALAQAYLGMGDLEQAREFVSQAEAKSDEGQPVDQALLNQITEQLAEEESAV